MKAGKNYFATDTAMTLRDTSAIESWHAHVYFDSNTRDAAWAFREQIEAHWNGKLQLGRFHERPVGPHPMWSYQLAFTQEQFAELIGWLTLNHGALDIFVHPNTGDALGDHRDAAIWIGRSHELVLSVLT